MTANVHSAARVTTQTLDGTHADTITLTGNHNAVEVKNRGSAGISFRVDGVTAVVDADENYFVDAGEGLVVGVPEPGTATAVSLISGTAVKYVLTAVTE